MSLTNPINTAEWIAHFVDSMRAGTDSAYGAGLPLPRLAGGLQGPMAYSNARAVSYEGIRAAILAGAGNTFFVDGMDRLAAWAWFYAAEGDNAPASVLQVADHCALVRRKSTGQWQILYKGCRAGGYKWVGTSSNYSYGEGQDTLTNGNYTIVAPQANDGYELWPRASDVNPAAINGFGAADRSLFADFDCIITMVRVRVVGADKGASKKLGAIGYDIYRPDANGQRYDAAGYPKWVMDAAASRWRYIDPSGDWQWVSCVGVKELIADNGIMPPWGNWGGDWQWNHAPLYGITRAQLEADIGQIYALIQQCYVATPAPVAPTPAPTPSPTPTPTPTPSPGPSPTPSVITKTYSTSNSITTNADNLSSISQLLGWTPAVKEVLISAGVTFRGTGNSGTGVSSATLPPFNAESFAADVYGGANNRAWQAYTKVTTALGAAPTVVYTPDEAGSTVIARTTGFTGIDPTTPLRDSLAVPADPNRPANADQIALTSLTAAPATYDMVFIEAWAQSYTGSPPITSALTPVQEVGSNPWTVEAVRQTSSAGDSTTGITAWRLVSAADERDGSGKLVVRIDHDLTISVLGAHGRVFQPELVAPSPSPSPTPSPTPTPLPTPTPNPTPPPPTPTPAPPPPVPVNAQTYVEVNAPTLVVDQWGRVAPSVAGPFKRTFALEARVISEATVPQEVTWSVVSNATQVDATTFIVRLDAAGGVARLRATSVYDSSQTADVSISLTDGLEVEQPRFLVLRTK